MSDGITEAKETAEVSENNGPQVVVFKLATGQDVVGKLLEFGESFAVVASPMFVQIVPQRGEGGGIGMALLPFSFAGKQDVVTISRYHIISEMAPDDQFKTQYLANLAGIVTPQGSPSGTKIVL